MCHWNYDQVVYKQFQSDPKVIDITVEDPSDEFRRIRNIVDIKLCRTLPAFSAGKLLLGFSADMAEAAKTNYKVEYLFIASELKTTNK